MVITQKRSGTTWTLNFKQGWINFDHYDISEHVGYITLWRGNEITAQIASQYQNDFISAMAAAGTPVPCRPGTGKPRLAVPA